MKCPPNCTCNRHKTHNKGNLKNPIILGRKNCGKCGRFRHVMEFDSRKRDENGFPISLQAACRSCTREIRRVHAGIQKRGEPYKPRRDRMSPDEYRAHQRRKYRENMQNPEWRARRNEYWRMYGDAKRRAQGVPRREKMFENRKGEWIRDDPEFPIGPFQEWIRERCAYYARTEMLEAYDGTAGLTYLADLCKVSDRILRRFLEGYDDDKKGGKRKLTHVRLATVDKCLVNEGTTFMWELYPDAEYA